MRTSIRIRDFMTHTDTTVPLYLRTVVSGPSGSGKSAVLEALCALLFGSTSRAETSSTDRAMIRHGAERASVELVVTGPGGDVLRLERRIGVGRTEIVLNGEKVSAARAWEAVAALFRVPSAAFGHLLLSPVAWQHMASGPQDGRALRDLLASTLVTADVDPLEGKLGDAEPRNEKAAEAARAMARRLHSQASGALAEAERALTRLPPKPELVPEEEIAAARQALAAAGKLRTEQAQSREAHEAWRRRREAAVRAEAARSAWLASKPTTSTQELDPRALEAAETAADLAEKAVRRAAEAHRKADGAHAAAAAKLDAARAMVARLNTELIQAQGAPVPGCVRHAGCQLNPAAKVNALTEERDAASREAGSLELEVAALVDDLARASSALESATAERADSARKFAELRARDDAWAQYAKALNTWKSREPAPAEDPGPEPHVADTSDGLEEHTATITRAAAAASAVEQWTAGQAAAAERVRALKAQEAEAAAKLRRAEEVVEIVRAAPGEAFAMICDQISTGPVKVEPFGEGLMVRLYGVPWQVASDGERIVGGAWLRGKLRALTKCRLPLVIDNVNAVGGLEWPAGLVAIWLHTTESGGFSVVDGGAT